MTFVPDWLECIPNQATIAVRRKIVGLADIDHKLRFGEQTHYKTLSDFFRTIRLANSLSRLASDSTMGGIRKLPLTDQRQSFRRRLQRALSLSSSGSEDIWIPPRSAAGDTTEDECPQEDDSFGNHRNGITADDGQESFLHTWGTGPRPDDELEQPGQDLSENCNMIAFQCLAE
jgi:hypothetical protein